MALVDMQDRRSDAAAHGGKASTQLERFSALGKPTPEEINDATLIYSNLATAMLNASRLTEAIAYSGRAVTLSENVPAAEMRRASAFGVLATALRESGELEPALEAARDSRTLLETLAARGGRNELYNLSLALLREGQVLGQARGISLDRPVEARDAMQRSLEIAEKLAEKDPNDSSVQVRLAVAADELTDVLLDDDPIKALAVADRALARLREETTNARLQLQEADILAVSSYAARRLHQQGDARERLRSALQILRNIKAYPAKEIEPGAEVSLALQALADDYAETGQTERAIATYRELLSGVTATNPDVGSVLKEAVVMSDIWGSLATLLRKSGQVEEALDLETKRTDVWARWARREPDNLFIQKKLSLAKAAAQHR
jgi:tetratricopeptide (TPR) repeat protein